MGGHKVGNDDDLAFGYIIIATSFYLSECKKSQPPVNQTGGVVHLLGNKPSHGLSGAGLTGDWLRANSIA